MAAGKAALAAELKGMLDFKKITNSFSLCMCVWGGGWNMCVTGCLLCRFDLIRCRFISDISIFGI